MLTRLLNAVLYILLLALVIGLIIWALGFLGVPAFVTQILIAIGVVLGIIVLLGVLTGKVPPPNWL